MSNYSAALGYENITPDQLRIKLQSPADLMLLDIRTPLEVADRAISGSYHIPMQELASRINELPKDKDIVVYCRIGNRSAYACMFLSNMGFQVKNLEGGIQLWNASQQSVAGAK